jgi:hypothetical protein
MQGLGQYLFKPAPPDRATIGVSKAFNTVP